MKLPGKGMSWKEFFEALRYEYKFDRLNDAAAALTFFGVLALFPFLIFLVALAGVIIDPNQIQQLIDELRTVAPEQVTTILSNQLRDISGGGAAGILSVGALAAIWAASKGILAATRALNVVYDVEEERPAWKVRLLSIGMTLLLGALGLVAALAAVATPAVANAVPEPFSTIIMWLRIPVAALIMMVVWALTYYVLPDVEQKFKLISPGSVFGVIVWALASWGFSVYVRNFGNYNATYGAIGGVIVLLFWMWISALVLLAGAEANSILEHRSAEGKAKGRKELGTRTPARDELVEREMYNRKNAKERKRKHPELEREHKHARAGTPGRERAAEGQLAFSPSQVTVSRRVERERAIEAHPQKSASRGTAIAATLWGAFVGLAAVRMRRRTA